MTMRRRGQDSFPVLGVAGALIALACCAGLPVMTTILGGLTLAALIGVAGGTLLLAAAVVAGALLICARRRRVCSSAARRVARDR
jgi:ABC-type transport system involved in cytochrome c biogenesis permease subunit